MLDLGEEPDDVSGFIQYIIDNPKKIRCIEEFYYLVGQIRADLVITDIYFIEKLVGDRFLKRDELVAILKYIEFETISNEPLCGYLKQQLDAVLTDIIFDIEDNFDVSEYIDKDSEYGHFSISESSMEKSLIQNFYDDISDVEKKYIKLTQIDLSDYVSMFDVQELIDSHFRSAEDSIYADIHRTHKNTISDIDDLFERS